MRGGLFPRDGKCAESFIPERWCGVRGALFPRDGAVCGELYSREMVRCAGSFIPEGWCGVRGALFQRVGAVCGEVYSPRNGRTSITVLNAAVSQQTHRVQELLTLIGPARLIGRLKANS